MSLRYHEFDPDPALSRYVLCYWEFTAIGETDVYSHRVMPDGCISVVYLSQNRVGEEGMMLAGPRLDALPVPVPPGAIFWGVRFWPDAASALLGLDPVALFEQVGPFAAFRPETAEALHRPLAACRTCFEAAQVFDAVLGPYVAGAAGPDPRVRAAVEALVASQGQRPVREVAQQIGLSERQLQRLFREAVGLTPKQFARIRRFRSTVGNMLRPVPDAWGTVAAAHGFADQAHLIREFSQLVGLTPTTFQERVRTIEHGRVNP